MSVNGASTICALASWIIYPEWSGDKPQCTYRQPWWAKMLLTISRPPPTIEHPRCVKARNTTQQLTALCCSWMEFYAVSRCNLSLYSTSQLCMQCLTDLIIFLVAVESIFKNPHSALLYCYFRQSLKSKYLAFHFLPPCRIHNLWTPHCSRLWSLPKLNASLFVVWATLNCKSSLMLGGFQWM